MADMVRNKITEEVKKSKSSVSWQMKQKMFKKRTDFSSAQLLFQWSYQESFLHFESAGRLDTTGLTEKIIPILECHGLAYSQLPKIIA